MNALATAFGAVVLGTMGCSAAMPSHPHTLAFEIAAEPAPACVKDGEPRTIADDASASDEFVAVAHEGWHSVTFASTTRGVTTIDLASDTGRTLGKHATLSKGSARSWAVDRFGHGILVERVPRASGNELRVTRYSCALRTPRPAE